MRADNVEPQELRTVLTDAANRVPATRLEREPELARGLFANSHIDQWATPRDPNGSAHLRPQSLTDPCGSTLCC